MHIVATDCFGDLLLYNATWLPLKAGRLGRFARRRCVVQASWIHNVGLVLAIQTPLPHSYFTLDVIQAATRLFAGIDSMLLGALRSSHFSFLGSINKIKESLMIFAVI